MKRVSPIPKWLLALLLILTLAVIGLMINAFIGSFIPFYMLFSFSIVFAIEKWFNYETKQHKLLGKAYRLILNLVILSLIGLIIWTGFKLFSHQFVQNTMIGSILFIAEFAFFIWLWKVVYKNSWRWPSMKLTIFTLICLFLLFSFAGVQPMSSYKDSALRKIQSTFSDENNNQSITTHSNNMTTTKEPVTTQENQAWTHTGYIQATMIGTNYSSITFQDGFSLNFVATVGNYSPPSIGGKFEVKYYYDSQSGGNVIVSLLPVP